MQEMAAGYDGPHKVVLNRNEPNLGLTAHFNTIMAMATGEFVIVAAGDDVSEPERCEIATAPLLADETLSCVSTAETTMDDAGRGLDHDAPAPPDHRITLADLVDRDRNSFHGAARCYRRASLLAFPPLDISCPTEDSTCKLRCLIMGDEQFLSARTVRRRIHAANLSGAASLRRMNLDAILDQYLRDARHACDHGYLSQETYRKIRRWGNRQIFFRKLHQNLAGDSRAPGPRLMEIIQARNIGVRSKLSAVRTVLKKALS
jgi:glycosyltransferase involved in cell wall biosynthesis